MRACLDGQGIPLGAANERVSDNVSVCMLPFEEGVRDLMAFLTDERVFEILQTLFLQEVLSCI